MGDEAFKSLCQLGTSLVQSNLNPDAAAAMLLQRVSGRGDAYSLSHALLRIGARALCDELAAGRDPETLIRPRLVADAG